MNYQEIVKRLNKLLGLYKFNTYKLKDSENELILEGDLAVGEPVYIITSNGQLPLSDGEYELEDTTKIKIQDGSVKEIKYDMEKKTQNFVEATLKNGTVVKSPTFDVGEDVFVVSPDGEESPAPDGEHELKLKDSEGKEVLIKIETKDGKITERENVELPADEAKSVEEGMGMTPDLSEGNDMIEDDFKKEVMKKFEDLISKIDAISSDYEDMKKKVAKFSKEPAGEPVKQAKNFAADFHAAKGDYLAQLVKIRANKK
jgi:major membrane immunogen (membrane-anchored lipoprotein)